MSTIPTFSQPQARPTRAGPPARWRWAPLAVACCGLAGGCGQTVHDLGVAGGGGAATGVVGELRRPDSQRALADVAGSPGGQQASQDVGVGIGRGLADEAVGLATGRVTVDAAATRAAGLDPTTRPGSFPPPDAGPRAAAFVRQTVDPIVAETVRTAVRQGLQEALSSQSRDDARAMAAAVTDATAHSLVTAVQRDGGPLLNRFTDQFAGRVANLQVGPAVDDVMANHVRPALRDFFRDDIAPTVIDILRESAANALKVAVRDDTTPAVVRNAANVSKGASFGSREGMVDLGLLQKDGSLTGNAKAAVWGIITLAVLAGLVGVAALFVLTMLAASLVRRRRSSAAQPS